MRNFRMFCNQVIHRITTSINKNQSNGYVNVFYKYCLSRNSNFLEDISKSKCNVPKLNKNILLAFSLVNILESVGLKKEQQDSELLKMMEKAKQILENGDIQLAAYQYNVALQRAEKLKYQEQIYYIKEQLAVIAKESEQFEKAEQLFKEVLEYFSRTGHEESDLKVVYINLKMAEIYQDLKDDSKAEFHFDKCYQSLKSKVAKMFKNKDEESMVLWIKILIGKGYYYLYKRKLDDAYHSFKEAYGNCIKFRGEVNEQAVLLLKNLGVVCFEKGELELAIDYLKKAVDIGKHLPGMENLSTVYTSLGNIYLKQGLLKEAELNCSQGYKNSTRHNFTYGIEEANSCLEEIKKAY